MVGSSLRPCHHWHLKFCFKKSVERGQRGPFCLRRRSLSIPLVFLIITLCRLIVRGEVCGAFASHFLVPILHGGIVRGFPGGVNLRNRTFFASACAFACFDVRTAS